MTNFAFGQITKLRVNTWKTPGVKSSKSYKHVALIQLSEIRSLFDIGSSSSDGKTQFEKANSLSNVEFFFRKENEQFGMLCSIDGQARQLIFRVAENNNMSITRSHLTDSMTSLTSLSTVSSLNQTNKTEVLQHLAKAIAEERCLLDKVCFDEFVFFFVQKSFAFRRHSSKMLDLKMAPTRRFHQWIFSATTILYQHIQR